MSSYDHANTTLNSFSCLINVSFSEEVKVLPIWTILGSSSAPRLTDQVSSFIGSTHPYFNSSLLKVSLPIFEIKTSKLTNKQNQNHIIRSRVLNRLNKNGLYRNTVTNRLNMNNNTSKDRLNWERDNVLARVSGSMVLIFSRGSSTGWQLPSMCFMLSIHSLNRSYFPLLLRRLYQGKYSNLFPSILSSSPSRFSRVKFLKLWIISSLSSVASLVSMSSSSLVYGVSEPSSELWNELNLGISLPCLSYQEPNLNWHQ